MDKGQESSSSMDAEQYTEDQKAVDAFNEIVRGAQGDFAETGYVCGNYTDAEGRVLEDVRLLRYEDEPGAYFLNANVGDPMALVELRNKLDERGIKIRRLVAYMPDLEVQKVLDNYSV